MIYHKIALANVDVGKYFRKEFIIKGQLRNNSDLGGISERVHAYYRGKK